MRGILDSESWQEIDQSLVTLDMKKKALRAHHIYDLKRSMDAKNRVVVNGKRQYESTFSEATCRFSHRRAIFGHSGGCTGKL